MPPHRTPLERLFSTQRRMNRGTLGGTLENAGPPQSQTRSDAIQRLKAGLSELPWAWGATLSGIGQRYYPPVATRYNLIIATLVTAGTSNTVFTVYKNGTSVGTVTLGSGVFVNTATIDVTALTTDYLQAEPTTAGTGAAKALVIVRRA